MLMTMSINVGQWLKRAVKWLCQLVTVCLSLMVRFRYIFWGISVSWKEIQEIEFSGNIFQHSQNMNYFLLDIYFYWCERHRDKEQEINMVGVRGKKGKGEEERWRRHIFLLFTRQIVTVAEAGPVWSQKSEPHLYLLSAWQKLVLSGHLVLLSKVH